MRSTAWLTRFERLAFTLIAFFLVSSADSNADDRDAELAAREVGNPGGTNYGEFAPADAYEKGSPHPFYGSENQWSRRMFSARAADLYYKRRGQRQLLEILDGNSQEAIRLADARLKEDPGDAESFFIKTLALAQLGRSEDAYAMMLRALEAGLPFSRFLAGPRELLAPVTSSDSFQSLAAKQTTLIVHGPMLGAVTDRSARFWIRTWQETDFEVLVESADEHHTGVGATKASDDFIGIAQIEGLSADTEYEYRIRILGRTEPEPGIHTLRILPSLGRGAQIVIGFGGCAGYTPAHERIWDGIASHELDAFLLLGDNVYIDLPDHPGALHDYTYYRRQSRPEFRRLVASTPVYAIWDDHDAAIDDIWMGPYVDRPDWKQPMVDHFRRNWNNPAYGSEARPGTWFSFSMGDVEIFMLDGRTYRTNPFLDHRSMLGEAQKAWLLNGLLNSTATFKVIASPVAWAQGAKPGSRDTWSGFPEEREEILSFVENEQIGGVILLSSDRHRSEAWTIERESGYAFHDFISGQLTNVHTHAKEPGALFSYNEKNSFGVLRFDLRGSESQVTYEVHSIDRELVASLVLKRTRLESRESES